ncbi:DMT family transporter [Paenibacillus yanchengensis]|uniref:DMT family transporter n=1 Tax=Paenibacillus yanchengensis TaxID=2035833 RepID=A0ABW4YQ96_9BACL
MQKNRNFYWIMLVIAGIFEVMWVIGLKHSTSVLHWALTVVAIIISFGLLIYCSQILPTSTAYAVFVGIGAAGTVISEMTIFGEEFRIMKVVLIAVLMGGIIGLKSVTDEQTDTESQIVSNSKSTKGASS